MTKPKETYKPANLSESLIITVRFSETDPLGIVWHGNYIKYFEDGREAFGRKYRISYLDVVYVNTRKWCAMANACALKLTISPAM